MNRPFDMYSIAFALLIGLATLLASRNGDTFLYDRNILAQGDELWRIVTGHLCHFSLAHGILNWLAMAILFVLLAGAIGTPAVLVCLLGAAVMVSAGFYFLLPELLFYGGLSGVLHALFALLAVVYAVFTLHSVGILMLVVLAAKLAYEMVSGGPVTGLEMEVITEAHLYGAIAGAILSIPVVSLRYNKP